MHFKGKDTNSFHAFIVCTCFILCCVLHNLERRPQAPRYILRAQPANPVHFYPDAMTMAHTIGPSVFHHDFTLTAFLPSSHRIYFAFLLSASEFLNGNPLVLLSAPVFLLIRPLLLANRMHHSATMARKPDPSVPRLNDVTPVWVHIA